MEKLLNVVDNTVFEVSRIISEQADPRDRFVDGRLMTRSDSLEDVMYQKLAYPIDLDVGNRPVLFPTPSGYLAGPAIRDTVANHDVALEPAAGALEMN